MLRSGSALSGFHEITSVSSMGWSLSSDELVAGVSSHVVDLLPRDDLFHRLHSPLPAPPLLATEPLQFSSPLPDGLEPTPLPIGLMITFERQDENTATQDRQPTCSVHSLGNLLRGQDESYADLQPTPIGMHHGPFRPFFNRDITRNEVHASITSSTSENSRPVAPEILLLPSQSSPAGILPTTLCSAPSGPVTNFDSEKILSLNVSNKNATKTNSARGTVAEPKQARGKTRSTRKWDESLSELIEFQSIYGHCNVSIVNTPEDSRFFSLIQWVKRQRYHRTLLKAGKPSSITSEQIGILEDIGFCWSTHDAAWEEKFAQLVEYKARYSHCNVPSSCLEYPILSLWVKRQRRAYNLKTLDSYRADRLGQLGFIWNIVEHRSTTRRKP